jgi:hypothetical protein
MADTPAMTDCPVAAFGVVQAPLDALPALRKRPGSFPGAVPPPHVLKHADEQTVLGLAAVLRAIEDFDLRGQDLSPWGVVAAPRFPGRLAGAVAMDRFLRQGPLTVSPLIIPNLSLHSASGTISLALGIHGPNFGAGGGPTALAEGLLAGLALHEDALAPGVWVVLSEWDPEPIPDLRGQSTIPVTGWAVALALAPAAVASSGLCLRLRPTPAASSSPPPLASLARFLSEPCGPGAAWQCSLPGVGAIELAWQGSGPSEEGRP